MYYKTYNNGMDELELTGWAEHVRDSEIVGDPRRCPRHPGERTSSDDGMFDAPCGLCEAAEAEAAEAWQHDPGNDRRPFCSPPVWISPVGRWPAGCDTAVFAMFATNDIPF